jgi:teichuronic acid biosynthesis glycosyltransferase TuaG
MDKNDQPFVSVIMPNYNGARFIGAAIESVMAQTYPNWELLVTDDGSKDDSRDIIAGYAAKDARVKLLETTFKKVVNGPAAARNTSIQAAKGRFIAFLDSDDEWLPEKLEKQVAFMIEKGAALSYHWYVTMDETGAETGGHHSPHYTKRSYRQMLNENVIGCLTSMYDSEKLGGKEFIDMSPDDPFADFSLWLKILKKTDYAWCLPERLARYRLVGGSISANKLNAAKLYWKILRRVEKLPLIPAAFYFCNYAVRGVTKKWRYKG